MTARAAYVVPSPSVTDLTGPVERHRDDVVGDELGAEALGLGPHRFHEVGAHDAVAEAGEVLDLGRVHQRAAGGDGPFEQQRAQPGAGGIHRGGVARRARPDDDHLAHLGGGVAGRDGLGGGGGGCGHRALR
jgi:hypothetical protein